MAMNGEIRPEEATRDSVLSPVDRVSEMLFGLFMALTFVGAVSVAGAGREHIREMFVAALGCNLAWGLVDAIMYLVRTVTDSGRSVALVRSVMAFMPRSPPSREVSSRRRRSRQSAGGSSRCPPYRRDRLWGGMTSSRLWRYS